jgi:hypothetical protein
LLLKYEFKLNKNTLFLFLGFCFSFITSALFLDKLSLPH